MRQEKGFTLIELVLVIALLGVLAVSAMPNIFSIGLTDARTNARDAVQSAIQTGLSIHAAHQISNNAAEADYYPTALDSATSAAASRSNPLFTTIIQGGVTKGWTKVDDDCYTYTDDSAGNWYKYTPASGTFAHVTTTCGS